MTLKVGEIVIVLGEEETGWWKGQLANKTGVFPSNFVELIDEKDAAQMETQHKHSGSLKPEKTVNILQLHLWFSCEMKSEKQAQKFHTDDVSLSRSGASD